MAKIKSKRTTITREAADRFSRKLEQLPDKKKTELTPKELIFENAQQLDDLLNRNYEYDDLVAILKADGIQISKATLRQYLSEARKAREQPKNPDAHHQHLPKTASTVQPKEPALDLNNRTAEPTPMRAKKLGKSRLQSEENADRYPGDRGTPIEMKT